MGIFSTIGKILAGGKQQKGESLENYNKRSNEAYKSR
jgi:hypothetical protein